MISVNHYAIRPAFDSKKQNHETLLGRNHGVLFRVLSQKLFSQILLPFSSTIIYCISAQNSFSCHNVLILLSLSDVTTLSLLVGICAAYMLAYSVSI